MLPTGGILLGNRQLPGDQCGAPLPDIKTNHDFYRLVAAALCATAANANAATTRDLKPVEISLKRPAVQWLGPLLGDTLDLDNGPVFMGPVAGGIGNNPIIVSNPPDHINDPITLYPEPIVINATGTLTLPGTKPRTIPIISPVTGKVIGQQVVTAPVPEAPLLTPVDGGLIVTGAGTLDLGNVAGPVGPVGPVGTIGGGTLNVTGSPGSISGGSISISNGGSLNMGGGVINTTGSMINTNAWSHAGETTFGTISISGGTLVLSPDATIETDISGASVIKIGTRTLTLNYTGGTIFNSAGVEIFGPRTFTVASAEADGATGSVGDDLSAVTGLTGAEALLKYANGGIDSSGTDQLDDFGSFIDGAAGQGQPVASARTASAVVPEPAALVGVAIGAFALAARRRRR